MPRPIRSFVLCLSVVAAIVVMYLMIEANRIDALIQELGTKNQGTAELALEARGTRAIPALLLVLEHGSIEQAIGSLNVLQSHSGSPEVVKAVVKLALSTSGKRQSEAARWLGYCTNDREAFLCLADLTSAPYPPTRSEVSRGLMSLDRHNGYPLVEKALMDRDEHVQFDSAVALAEAGFQSGITRLAKLSHAAQNRNICALAKAEFAKYATVNGSSK